jgi:TP901 family phage tail tape measure protein
MMNGPLGLGLTLKGTDQASPSIARVKRGLVELRHEAGRSRDSVGRFTGSATQGVATMNRGLVQMHAAGVKARDQVSDLFGDVRAFGLRMAAGGGIGLGAGFGLATANGELSDALAGLKVVVDAGDAEMARFKSVALDMGMTSQFTASQVANSLTDIASAGYNAKDSVDLLRPSLNLATASLGQLTASDAAGVTAQALKAFGLQSKDAGASVDKMVASMNLFALQAKDLPLGLQNSVRGAFNLGQSLDETLISLGLVKNIMPRTESAATAVSMAMERLADKKVQTDLRGLGVAVVDNAGRFRPFLDVVGDLGPKLRAMTEAQRASFLQTTFGTEAVGGLNAIMGQLTAGVQTQTGETVKGAAAVAYLVDEPEDAAVLDLLEIVLHRAADEAVLEVLVQRLADERHVGDELAPPVAQPSDVLVDGVLEARDRGAGGDEAERDGEQRARRDDRCGSHRLEPGGEDAERRVATDHAPGHRREGGAEHEDAGGQHLHLLRHRAHGVPEPAQA